MQFDRTVLSQGRPFHKGGLFYAENRPGQLFHHQKGRTVGVKHGHRRFPGAARDTTRRQCSDVHNVTVVEKPAQQRPSPHQHRHGPVQRRSRRVCKEPMVSAQQITACPLGNAARNTMAQGDVDLHMKAIGGAWICQNRPIPRNRTLPSPSPTTPTTWVTSLPPRNRLCRLIWYLQTLRSLQPDVWNGC